MKKTAENVVVEIKKKYEEMLLGDVMESYLLLGDELNDLYSQLETLEIQGSMKPLLQEIQLLNNQLIERINSEKLILTKERSVFEKQKNVVEYYANYTSQHDAYFIDKKR